jgi:adenylate cyclase class IV
MPRNIEIKACIDDLDAVLARSRALANGPEVLIEQDDTFYPVASGRLKLRRFADGSAELIHYERPDGERARASDYVRVPTDIPDALHEALARGLGLLGRVRKRRWLLLAGQTRIHLDHVEHLGDFLELEVVLREGQTDAEGVVVAEGLMQALGLAQARRLAGAYLDLLRERAASADGR